MDVFNVAARWVHVAAVVVAVGGSFFLRFALLPSTVTLPQPAHDALRAAVLARWKLILRACNLFIPVSGLYNFVAVTNPAHRGQLAYHALIVIKFALALLVLTIGEGLVGRAPPFEFMRRRPAVWLSVNLALAAAIVGISSAIRFLPPATSQS